MQRIASSGLLRPLIMVLIIQGLLSCGDANEEGSDLNVIYGTDNREDVFASSSDQMKVLARSTAALVKTSSIQRNANGTVNLPTRSYGSSQQLCSTERFFSQPNPAFCSGFLVAPNILVTAGHCITSNADCSSTSFVFGMGYFQQQDNPTVISATEVYQCQEVLRTQAPSNDADFAVIKLDRNVVGREPLRFRRTGKANVGDPLTVIGHPSGLPTKITDGATVRSNSANGYLVADTDTYGGNSGSAVFSSTTGTIEGILVRGEVDFESRNGCNVSKVCAQTGCRGEDITLASAFAPYVPNTDPSNPPPPAQQNAINVEQANLQVPIPDNNEVGVSQALNVDKAGRIVSAQLDVKIKHTYSGDLVIRLVHPDGTAIVLRSREGGSVDDVNASFAQDKLAVLSGKNSKGVWKLEVSDRASIDTGALNYVKLSLNVEELPSAPLDQNEVRVSNINRGIPDFDTQGIQVDINVTRAGEIKDLGIAVNITHPYIGDLVVVLVHPSGQSVTLHNKSGGSADNIIRIYGLNGEALPELNRLKGLEARGRWQLRVSDVARADTGVLNSAALTIGY